jgi:hypothetical protein
MAIGMGIAATLMFTAAAAKKPTPSTINGRP